MRDLVLLVLGAASAICLLGAVAVGANRLAIRTHRSRVNPDRRLVPKPRGHTWKRTKGGSAAWAISGRSRARLRPRARTVPLALTLALAVTLLLTPSPASAARQILNFDSQPPGTVVSGGPLGLTFPGSPVVFDASGSTQSDPNALRMPGDCPNGPVAVWRQSCTTDDNLLEMRFENPVSYVTARVGALAPRGCFEFDCPTVKMVGFNAAGDVVATTAPNVTAGPITNQIVINAFDYVISRAVIGFSEDPETGAALGPGGQHTAQIDDLSYDPMEPGDLPPLPPPGPPSVSISSPAAGSTSATTELTVSGTASARPELANFCAVANGPTTLPPNCLQTRAVRSDNSFTVFRIPGVRPGTNEIRVWVRDSLGRTVSSAVNVTIADGDVDYRTESLELTQVVQTATLPAPGSFDLPGVGSSTRGATYDGVPLSRDKLTIARLFAAAQAPGPVVGATAELHGFIRGPGGGLTRAPGSPLRPHSSPTALSSDPDLGVLRADPKGAFNFLLPPSWTAAGRELVLRGEVAPTTVGTDVRECCRVNNSFWMNGIDFSAPRPLRVLALGLTYTEADGTVIRPTDPLQNYFDDFRMIWPGRTTIANAGAEIDLTDAVDDPGVDALDAANARISELYEERPPSAKVVGLSQKGLGGGKGPGPTAATSEIERGLDFVAHETGHSIGLAHAHSTQAQHDGGTDDHSCAPHDGPINGVGIDPRIWSGGEVGVFKLIGEEQAGVFDATPDAPAAVYDYMSYCSNEGAGATWVASGYWANTLRELAPGGRLVTDFGPGCCFLGAASDPTVRRARAAAAASGGAVAAARKLPIIRISATLGADGEAAITRVEPDEGTPDPPDTGSGTEVVIRDSVGSEISRTPVAAAISQQRPADGLPEAPSSRLINVAVSGTDAAAKVEIVDGGTVVASRSASPASPKVQLKSPKKGGKIKAKGKFTVSWKASDGDGDPLESKVQFSPDGGKSWNTLALGLEGSKVRLDGSRLPATKKGVLEVTVSDGFNVDRASVEGIRAQGGKPTVEITTPGAARTALLGDTVMVLEGYGFDAAGEPLRSKDLVWRSGKKELGKGERIGVPAYKLGKTVVLSGRDSDGGKGSDKVKFKVQKVAPLFTVLEAKPLKGKSKNLQLKLASTLPSKVQISGGGVRKTRSKLDGKTRSVKLKATGKTRDSYELRLTLSAAGKKTTETLTVSRG